MENTYISLKVSQLVLDSRNPRLAKEASGDLSALAAIIKKSPKKLLKLAQHIATNGVNPLDRLMVHPVDDGKFVADEGNRRTSALRLLNDPSIAEAIDKDFYKKIRRIVENAKHIPHEIDCVIVQSEQERNIWLEVRHLGENEGSGTSPWGATESARFAKRQGSANRMEFGLKVIDLILSRCKLTKEEEETISNLPITTLERMLGDPSVRKALGIARSKLGIALTVKDEYAVLNSLKLLALDVASGVITARKVNSAIERVGVVSDWPAKRKPGLHGEPIEEAPLHPSPPPPTPPPTKAQPQPPSKPTPRMAQSPDQRSKLVPVGFHVTISDKKVYRILIELKKLDVEGFENAISVLLRVFLELSVDAFLDRVKRTPHENTKLKIKMEIVADEWEKSGAATSHQTKAWRSAASTHVLFSLNTLHGYVHDRHGIPTRRELLQTWDKMEHFVKLLWP